MSEHDTPSADAPTREDGLSDADASLLDATIATLRVKADRDHDLHINNSDVAMLLRLLVNVRALIRAGHAARGDEARDAARYRCGCDVTPFCTIHGEGFAP